MKSEGNERDWIDEIRYSKERGTEMKQIMIQVFFFFHFKHSLMSFSFEIQPDLIEFLTSLSMPYVWNEMYRCKFTWDFMCFSLGLIECPILTSIGILNCSIKLTENPVRDSPAKTAFVHWQKFAQISSSCRNIVTVINIYFSF